MFNLVQMGSNKIQEDASYFGTLKLEPDDVNEVEQEETDAVKYTKPSPQSHEKEKNAEPEEQLEENGVLFWVNRSGFPINDKTWDRMYDHASKIHPDGYDIVKKIKYVKDLPEISVPQAPVWFPTNTPIFEKLEIVQKYMQELQYNHTGTQFFEIRKNRPLTGLMDCAKEMIRESLPIKCLEAIILGIFLTNGMAGLERFTISFKTMFNGNYHRHVVLGVLHGGKYGAIGMSRRNDLMYKPLEFSNLSSVVVDFVESYNHYWHEVKKVKIGLPIPHDSHSYEQISWKYLTLNLSKLSRREMCRELDRHSRETKAMIKTMGGNYSPRKPNPPPASPSKETSSLGPRQATKINKSPSFYKEKTSIGEKKTLSDPSYQIRI